jgi:hypothetical protein
MAAKKLFSSAEACALIFDDDSDESEDGSKADPSMRLINTTPINLEQQIDDPVTSGGDVVVGNPAN